MTGLLKRFVAVFTLVSLELAVLAGVAIVSVLVFLLMAKTVFIDQNNALDQAAFAFAEAHTNNNLTRFMRFITFFASRDFLIIGSVVLSLFFFFIKKHRWYSVKIPVIAAGSSLLNQGMKLWFDRPRPETAFYEQPGFSFPSGHAMIGGAFYGLLIYLAWTSLPHKLWRWFLVLILSIGVLLIGSSRIYLHVHYASDVIAGWSAGFVFLIICLLIMRQLEPKYARKAHEVLDQDRTA
ncbi:MAG: phosphoesterase PA-phosphatase [Cytophagales bacterium CG18_big_fil_WC_8_21_14_2_50_42_9]|nr:MAG: phosphoesterase PA-phosphatase [Cytophagales bacterium CG18_big_fil_WC_8_21_14_2_50_42_9]